MRRLLLIAVILIILPAILRSQTVKTPGEFLGYEQGTQFTWQYKAIEYFRYVSETSPMAEFREYGKTYEGRTLGVCFVSSPENIANLETYRKNNLIRAGLLQGEVNGKQIPFIWLSYNVHGNEAVGTEAAMKTLYTLVSGSFPGVADYLKECIVVIDPCQNPDGHDLYTERYRTSMSSFMNPDPNAWEHHEGWPGSRTNHYLFDLNRDWTWQTQAESQQKVKMYRQVMPQVHADFHEMGPESTFFFAPGASPWHDKLTEWQHEFHKLMGSGNAALFDSKYRLYFTKENFDLFYPSYGDTWPLFNGAMGFTYEQGGGGASGLAYKQESGDTLTLKQRIDGHFTASMATIKVAFENRTKLISEFNKYFESSGNNHSYRYKSFIIKGTNEKSNIRSLLQLLDNNQIRYSYAENEGKKYSGFDYLKDKNGIVTIEKGDILISAYQPESHLLEVLFEPHSKMTDSISYDLTAWAIPFVYNLKAFALKERIQPDTGIVGFRKIINIADKKEPYAYLANFTGFDELKLMASLYRKDVKLRYSMKPFKIEDRQFNRGSIIIARGDNKQLGAGFDSLVTAAANECQVELIPSNTGLVQSGRDFGSEYAPLMKKRDIALLCGEKTSSSSVGELWFYFEQELHYPVSLINMDLSPNADLSKYKILILTSGSYSKEQKDTIMDFLKRGGKVIAFERAVTIFAGEKGTALASAVKKRGSELKASEKKTRSDDTTLLKKYEYETDRRYSLANRSEGSIYRVHLDDTHPYAFGMGNEWFVLKRSAGYPFLVKGNNIGYVLDKEPVSGFAGFKYKDKIKNTLVIGSEKIGSGEVVYVTDDPYFRGFWKSGRVLIGNIVLR
ncbi:MAG TPA: M14 family zinc carboxypeptidase [Bacteroidales bacterium]|nr:M14 family zinc carboxypeptidase [Bacteroidales bacterium]